MKAALLSMVCASRPTGGPLGVSTTRSPSHGRPRRFAIPLLVAAFFATSPVPAEKTEDQQTLMRRYPFDPACPWGRIADGKGMLVRCIEERESRTLAKATPAAIPQAAPAAATPTPSPPGVAPTTGSGGAAPVAPGGAAAGSAGAAVVAEGPFRVDVGPIVADQGLFDNSKLAKPKDRYAKCVVDHAGLTGASGEVHVRFLVRSKGIAEGVSVHKRVNVSAEAARCVSEIVDRRRVGAPEAPLVGATVIIKFDRLGR